jgi:tetratricopeptide (TPR) repeat protein
MDEQRGEFQHNLVDQLQEQQQELYQHHYQHDRYQHQPLRARRRLSNEDYDVYSTHNNTGVMLLREKRYLDAANCFCHAVKYVNERSMYNCPSNDDSSPGYDLRPNCHDDRRQSQSTTPTPTPTLSNEIDFLDNDASSVDSSASPSEETDAELDSSLSNQIDSFYLLLDEENGDNNSTDGDGSTLGSLLSRTNDRFQRRSSMSSVDSTSTISSQDTYVFPNPIIVSKRGMDATTASRNLVTPETTNDVVVSPSDSASNGSTPSPSEPSPPVSEIPIPRTDPNATTTIGKEACAKLSLISVYNMALTYHLAALDNENDNEGVAEIEGNLTRLEKKQNRTSTDDVLTVNPDSSSCPRTAHVPPGSSSYEYTRPTKRQRVAGNCCDESKAGSAHPATAVTTTVTPFGECDTQYEGRDGPSEPNPATHNSATSSTFETNNSDPAVDRVLLGQALNYYEIAYRILMSEQRVLVSQAMVILNNIGHIHRLMGQEEKAKRCFQRLLTTMVYLQQTGDWHQISHWNSFLTNVIDLIVLPENSHKKFAPAA